MRYFLLSVLAMTIATLSAQSRSIDSSLKKELDSMFVLDQVYRATLMHDIDSQKSDSLSTVYNVPKEQLPAYLASLQANLDSSNQNRLKQIIQQYGYPGKSLVGEPTNGHVFYMLQHFSSYADFLPLIKQAAEKGEITSRLYAIMLDRSLADAGKAQIYGTQAKSKIITNAQTGQKESKLFIWPVLDPAKVNNLRKAAGLEETVEETSKRLGFEYKVLSLLDVKNM